MRIHCIKTTRILVHLIDGAAMAPLGDDHKINRELALFNEDPAPAPLRWPNGQGGVPRVACNPACPALLSRSATID
jgi:hypothetical protein